MLPGLKKHPDIAGYNGLGRSRGGFGTKIHLATDGNGLPLNIVLSPGLVSTNFVEMNAQGFPVSSYWSPNEVAVILSALFLAFLILLLPFACLSAWILARRKGLLICLLLLIVPGILSLFHLLPAIRWLPSTYAISGTGATGNPVGIGSLSFIGLLCGWVFTILINDIFTTGEKFRQWADIFLILTALGNGVFWVSDREATAGKTAYEQTITDMTDSANYLLAQVKDYSQMCENNGLSATQSCQWASYIQETLQNIASTKSSAIEYVIPESIDDFYRVPGDNVNADKADKIRQEFQNYNESLCPASFVSKQITIIPAPSRWCQSPPPVYCNAIQEGKFKTDMTERFAVANECIITSLLRYREVLSKEALRLSLSKNNPHYRWIWFIVMSFFIGGKVANVMTKISDVDSRKDAERKRIKYISVKIINVTRQILISCIQTLRRGGVLMVDFIKGIWKHEP